LAALSGIWLLDFRFVGYDEYSKSLHEREARFFGDYIKNNLPNMMKAQSEDRPDCPKWAVNSVETSPVLQL